MLQKPTSLSLLLVLSAASALAQFDSAVVLGTIRDPQGLAIKGAQIRLDSLATGVRLNESTTILAILSFPPSASASIN